MSSVSGLAGPAGLLAAGPEGATDRESAERLSEDLIAMMDRRRATKIRGRREGRKGQSVGD